MFSTSQPDWQPHLTGENIDLRPLVPEDFEALFRAASDPQIWEQHPDRLRYTRERFEVYFRSGLDSGGALVVHDRQTRDIIGSSRFSDYRVACSSVEIGFTFLTRAYWGRSINRELKSLMLGHAFRWVETAYFVVGRENH